MSDAGLFLRRSVRALDAVLRALDENRPDIVRARPALAGEAAKVTEDALRLFDDSRLEALRLQRRFREQLDAITPVRPASSASLQAVRGISARVGSILEGKEK